MSTTSGALSTHTKNNLDLSTKGMIYTLIINIVMFLFLLCFFEANRFYRQIFLKRFQKRFIDIGRVPPIPPQHVFGWLVAVFRVPELEVLHMVGLDGYMLLRYHTVCLKFSLFASATGLLVLLPTYSTVPSPLSQWDKYTLMNVLAGPDEGPKYRLWVTAIFGYIFAAYFCQLLFSEYHNFSLQRLHYLAQADLASPDSDPDTLPQKYYTVMLERIPANLRSSEKLYEYFEELFPGDVFTVEVALDLRGLNSMISRRKQIRNSLEKAIAVYVATAQRPTVSIKTGAITLFPDDTVGLPTGLDAKGWVAFLQQWVAPERFGFEKLDSINYYTQKLVELNQKTKEMQDTCFEVSRTTNADVQRKLKNKYDTRAAAAVENITKQGNRLFKTVKQEGGLETLLFGPDTSRTSRKNSIVTKKTRGRGSSSSNSNGGKVAAMGSKSSDSFISEDNDRADKAAPVSSSTSSFLNSVLHSTATAASSSSAPGTAPVTGIDSTPGANLKGIYDSDTLSDDAVLVSPGDDEDYTADGDGDGDGDEGMYGADPHPYPSLFDRIAQSATSSSLPLPAPLPASDHAYLMADQGPFRESRKAVHFSESIEDSWEDVRIDVAPFTSRPAIMSPSSDESKMDTPDDSTVPSSSSVPIPLEQSFMVPQSEYIQAQRKADAAAKEAVLAAEQRFGDVTAAELVFCESISTSLGSADSPLETDSEKTTRAMWGGSNVGATSVGMNAFIKSVNDQRRSSVNDSGNKGMKGKSASHASPDVTGQQRREFSPSSTSASSTGAGTGVGTGNSRTGAGSIGGSTGAGSIPKTRTRQPIVTINLPQSEMGNEFAEKAITAGREGWAQTKIAGIGALRGVLEVERAFEMLTLGAYYKYSSTAFVTFRTRMAETIAHQMLLTNDMMEICHAPNPHDVIWENVAIPKSQVIMRSYITNVGLIIGSVFWSTLVSWVNSFARLDSLPEEQQNYLSVVILLMFLLILPFIFDTLARNYEGMKLESEIQNAIMSRYFYYQMVNIYVNVGLGGLGISDQLLLILKDPQNIVDLLGGTVPAVSLYFLNLVIVKVFAAVPIEMCRPWQLTTILSMGYCMDRRKCTRRELRTGAFFAWPMLYGWVYPNLMMVLMIIVTYSWVAPLLMPMGALFYSFSYLMYKYQLLYVYINKDQSGGFMWYAVFNRSLTALLFGTITLLGYLGLHLNKKYASGPFFFMLPLPLGVAYFWHYCDARFKKTSLDLSFGLAKQLDHYNRSRKEAGLPIPQDHFKKHLFRQPTLTEPPQYPEPYRKEGEYGFLSETGRADESPSLMSPSGPNATGGRMRSKSINVHALMDESEDPLEILEAYFNSTVMNLTEKGASPSAMPTVTSPFHHSPSPSDKANSASASTSTFPQQERSVGETVGDVDTKSMPHGTDKV